MQVVKKNRTYRCPSCLDLDICILKICFVNLQKRYYKLKVCWIYRNNPNEIIMDNKQYKISFENFNKWILLDY